MTAVRHVIRGLGESRSRRDFDNHARGPRRKFNPKTKRPRIVKVVRGACEHAGIGRDRNTNGRGSAFETPLALLFIMMKPTPSLAASALLPASEGLGGVFPGIAAAPRHRRADALEPACDTELFLPLTEEPLTSGRARNARPLERWRRNLGGGQVLTSRIGGSARNDLRRPFGFSGISPRQPVFMVVAAGSVPCTKPTERYMICRSSRRFRRPPRSLR